MGTSIIKREAGRSRAVSSPSRIGFFVTNMSPPTSLREKLIKIGAKVVTHGLYLPDGRGRHATANVPGDFAADRGTAAAASTRVRLTMIIYQEQPTGGVRSKSQKMTKLSPLECRPGGRVTAVSRTAHLPCRKAGKTRIFTPVLGFIRGRSL